MSTASSVLVLRSLSAREIMEEFSCEEEEGEEGESSSSGSRPESKLSVAWWTCSGIWDSIMEMLRGSCWSWPEEAETKGDEMTAAAEDLKLSTSSQNLTSWTASRASRYWMK